MRRENWERETALRREVIEVTHMAADQGLLRSSDGNISVRLDDERFLVTPSGLYKMRMEPDYLVIVDADGQLLEGKNGMRPTSEIQMHMEAYRQRPDIEAVLHAHPPYATALTIAGIPFPVDMVPEVLVALGEVPTAPYATPGTQELALSVREPIQKHDAILLSHHGSLTVGKTLEQALIALERLEHTAHMYYLAHCMGGMAHLPPEEVVRLKEIGDRLRGK